MRLLMTAVISLSVFALGACTSSNISENKSRMPQQASGSGVGSIGSGTVGAENARIVVRKCDESTPTSLENYMDKKSYSNENIRIFWVDTGGEPVCCSSHLIIYMLDQEGHGSDCFHVASDLNGLGFNSVQMNKIKSSYSASKGLTLQIPFSFYRGDGTTRDRNFNLLINQANRTVEVQ